MNSFKYRIFYLLVVICFSLQAQVSHVKFKHLTSKEGLANDIVYKIIQDYRGFIWIATENGLHQFDGYSFVNYTNLPNDKSSIAGSIIFDILEDSVHNLWVANTYGLDLFDRENRKFIHIPLVRFNAETKKNDTLFGINARTLFEDNDGRLLVGTSGEGVLRFDPHKRLLTPLSTNPDFLKRISTIYNIKSLCRDKHNVLWLTNQNEGVYAIDEKNEKVTFYKYSKKDHFYSYYLSSIKEDHQGKIWVATELGLNFYNRELNQFVPELNLNSQNGSVPNLNASSIYEDEYKNIWIALNDGAINIYNYNLRKFTSIIREPYNPNSLNTNQINSIFVDKQGLLWVSTNRGGVNYAPFYQVNKFEQLLHYPQENKGLQHPSVGSVFEDKEGNLWIGTDGGGLHFLDAKTKKITVYRHNDNNPRSLGSDFILCINQDKKGNIWVGGYKAGLNKFNPATKDFTVFHHIDNDSNSLGHDDVRAIFPNDDGTIWIASNGGGIQLFEPKNGKFTKPFEKRKNFYIGLWCLGAYKDSKSNYWFYSYYGVVKYNPATKSIKNYINSNENDSVSISNNWVYSITEDIEGNIWIGTESGLNVLDPSTDKIKRYSTTNGLPSNIIDALLCDENGNLWIGTDMGLSKFDFKDKKFINYDINDGIPGNQFIHGSCFKNNKGRMFFGTTSGLLMFYPKEIKRNTFVPPVYITDLLINYHKAEIGDKNSPLKKDISEASEILLRYGQTTVTFKYVALNFINPDKNQYAYMMEGFDKDWNLVGNKRDATYTNLDPGTYTFKVKASNNNGVWNDKGVAIKVIVFPPWWASWWFKTLVVLVLLVSVFSFYFIRTTALIRRHRILEKMVHERTQELQQMNENLEEKQVEILAQKEELMSQRDALTELNQELVKHQDFIEHQNVELDKHKNQLEKLVLERTAELERAMKKAEESDRLKTAFLANMSHEIRTPLNAIVGFTNLIIDSDFNSDEKKEFEKIINKSTENLLKLINDILDLSKIEAGETVVVNSAVNINDLLKGLKIVFTKAIVSLHRENVQLFYNEPDNNQEIISRTDSQKLTQILSNLIDNAIKYTPEGKVEFGFQIADDQIEFFVRDSGVGIPQEHLRNIFNRFNKIENDSSRLFRGAGLGLAISRQLANLLKGTIWAESELGKGSCFYLRIPYEPCKLNTTQAKSDQKIEHADLSGKVILVVEDEIYNFKMIENALRKTKAQVVNARTGIQALEYYKKYQPHIILMDIKIPELPGTEVMKKIREHDEHTPIIAQTAFAMQNEEITLKSSGFDDYIAKPFKAEDIIALIQKYL